MICNTSTANPIPDEDVAVGIASGDDAQGRHRGFGFGQGGHRAYSGYNGHRQSGYGSQGQFLGGGRFGFTGSASFGSGGGYGVNNAAGSYSGGFDNGYYGGVQQAGFNGYDVSNNAYYSGQQGYNGERRPFSTPHW